MTFEENCIPLWHGTLHNGNDRIVSMAYFFGYAWHSANKLELSIVRKTYQHHRHYLRIRIIQFQLFFVSCCLVRFASNKNVVQIHREMNCRWKWWKRSREGDDDHSGDDNKCAIGILGTSKKFIYLFTRNI